MFEELEGPGVSGLGVRSRKLSNFFKGHKMGDQNLLSGAHALGGTLRRWYRLHLQSLAPALVSGRVDVRRTGRKNNCRIFITIKE
jgi:hypothetical protein